MTNLEFITQEPAFWSRVGFAEDPTRIDENGNIVFYSDDWSNFIEEHKLFYQKGIKLHTTIIHNGWIDVDKYDFSAVDKTLHAICSIAKDIKYIPRIKLNPPINWCKQHPTEVYLNYNAPQDTKDIVKLINTLEPYYSTDGIKPNAPMQNGVAGLQSFCSEIWLKDALKALEILINHIENSEYANQIAGYQLGIGMCGENSYWGGWSDSYLWGDFGITAAEKFKNFCISKYGSLEEVLKTYKISDCVHSYQLIPTPYERLHTPKNLRDFFRVDNVRKSDYAEFLSKCTADAVCLLAKGAKEFSGGKPIGTFYGYIYTATPSESGHLAINQILDCESIDYLASPKGYFNCGPGCPGGTQAIPESTGLKKIWFDEIDNGTHIAPSFHNPKNLPKTMSETKTVLWREVCKNLAWGNLNFWWMDLSGGWYCDKEIMDEIEKIYNFNMKTRKIPHKSISEILLINDENSIKYYNCDKKIAGCHNEGIMNLLTTELLMCGAPVDEYRLSDIEQINLSQYKMIVFTNTYCVDKKTRDIIKNISKNTLCIFNYTAGILNPEFSLDNVEDLTSIAIEEYNVDFNLSDGYNCGVEIPPVKIKKNPTLQIIDTYADGEIRTARNYNNILCTSPYFRSSDFHILAKANGCHMYAPAGCTVYADNRFVGIFSDKTRNELIHMACNATYIDELSKKVFTGTNISNMLKEKNAVVLTKVK